MQSNYGDTWPMWLTMCVVVTWLQPIIVHGKFYKHMYHFFLTKQLVLSHYAILSFFYIFSCFNFFLFRVIGCKVHHQLLIFVPSMLFSHHGWSDIIIDESFCVQIENDMTNWNRGHSNETLLLCFGVKIQSKYSM
jgi:hypothetical protein